MTVELRLGDCLELMRGMPDKSVDLVLTDPPYKRTAHKWDVAFDAPAFFTEGWRITKNRGAIVMFSIDPFGSKLINASAEEYRYKWIWDKRIAANWQLANVQPLNICEEILVFSQALAANGAKQVMRYFPQKTMREKPIKSGGNPSSKMLNKHSMVALGRTYTDKFPTTLLRYDKPTKDRKHPTQKPVELMKYLVRTYSLEGDTILDPFMGSGTTGVACVQTGRNFIGYENNYGYFSIAERGIEQAVKE